MKKSQNALRRTLVPIVLIGILIMGAIIYLYATSIKAISYDLNIPVNENEGITKPNPLNFPVNENGQTYGSMANSNHPDEYPDLILAVATNGKEGYIYFTDTDDHPKNFVDPVEHMEKLKNLREKGIKIYKTLNVYEVDGVTVIGEFEIPVSREIYIELPNNENDLEAYDAAIKKEIEKRNNNS